MELDRIKAAVAAIIDWRMSRMDFVGLQAATVKGQNSDGTLEVQFEDAKYGQLTSLKIVSPNPGSQVKVSAGARVIVGWVGANPDMPIAVAWDTGSTTELDVNATTIAFQGGGTPVAKEGSGTTGHTHTVTGFAGPYPISATITTATDTVASGQGSQNVKVP